VKVTYATVATPECHKEQFVRIGDVGPKIKVRNVMDPEDGIIGRSIPSLYSVVDMISRAHEAGKNGEPLEIVERHVLDAELFEEIEYP
jgi:hypothetical protein